MKEIINILIESQEMLNNMDNKENVTIKQLESNKLRLNNIVMKSEKDLYRKYINIHNVILQSAHEFLNSNNEVYKLQPLFFYYNKDYNIINNCISFYLREKEVIFDTRIKKMFIHDEYFIENDQLFEKRNIPLIIKIMVLKKDLDALSQLEEYIKELINYAQKTIDKENFL
jgi:hypothetical protein